MVDHSKSEKEYKFMIELDGTYYRQIGIGRSELEASQDALAKFESSSIGVRPKPRIVGLL